MTQQPNQIQSLLLNGLKGHERQAMLNQIMNSGPLLKRLEECLKKDYDNMKKVVDDDFNCPSWSHKQAFNIGLEKGLTRTLEYVKIGV